jgi:MFS family permease
MEQTISFHFQDRLALSTRDTPKVLGLALVAYGVVAVFAQGYVVRKKRMTPLIMLAAGLPIALLGYVALIFAGSFGLLTLALAVQGLGQGLAAPGVTAGLSLSVSESDQGSVAGLNSSAQAFGRMLGPVVGTGLYQIRPEYPYALSTLLLCFVMASFAFNRKLKKAVSA